MFEGVIVDQNPHWDGTQYDGGVPRSVLEGIKKNFDLPYILSIVGVRRCGKSTLPVALSRLDNYRHMAYCKDANWH